MKTRRIRQISVFLVVLALVIGLISPVYGAGLVLDETETDTYEGTDAYAGDLDLQEDIDEDVTDNEGEIDLAGADTGSTDTESQTDGTETQETTAVEPTGPHGSGPYTTNNGTVIYMPYVEDNSQRVYDYADLLTTSEEKSLSDYIAELEGKKKCEIIILTSSDIPLDISYGNETSMKYAEQFYMDNSITDDGLIFLLDMNNRMIWTAGSGKYKAEKYVDFEEKVYNDVLDGMRNQRYYDVCNTFLKDVYKLDNIAYAMMPTPFSLIISAVLSLITLVSLLAKHSSSQPPNNAKIAVKTLNFRQTGHNAIFLGKHTSQRRIVKEHHSSGGGGGFSGGTHSGGGFSGGGGGFSGGGGHF
ncbi:MAG: TPM domain-containing protein [Lachnospiraceae bacterium]|nr:TPM domain-containing protein [Lachnospiraceae bacterium]